LIQHPLRFNPVTVNFPMPLTLTADCLIINARVPGYPGLQQFLVEAGRIRRLISMVPLLVESPFLPTADQTTLPVIDVLGDWLSLGGMDLQINGALGLAFPDLAPETADRLPAICQFLWNQGIDGFLPTLVTASLDKIHCALATIAQFQAAPPLSRAARILGVHLEGPCLNPQKRGAHPSAHLQPLTLDSVKQILGDYTDLVKVITLAPELDPTGTVVPYLRSLGIVVSLGHSLATATQAQQAFDQGATMVTHAFNAMPSLHHREPGLLGAAIVHPGVRCGLIADGQHVSPLMMSILLRASEYEAGVFLVSDALAPLGLPDGRYPWDEREIEVINGTARLLDGTLSGTARSLLSSVQNLVHWGLCSVETAIALATTAPRQAIGLPAGYGAQPAYLLRWSQDRETSQLTWQRLML
jgi:N-acetylglucosamine-6-phosphate deacetylase